jgi:hypothetical protein
VPAVPSTCPSSGSRRSPTVNSDRSPEPLSRASAPWRAADNASEARASMSTLVRAGSAWHQEPLVLGGHARSRPASRNCRSQAVHRYDLHRRSSTGQGSKPSPYSCRGPAALADEPSGRRGRASPCTRAQCRRRQVGARPGPPAGVPSPCHSRRAWPVPSGQPRSLGSLCPAPLLYRRATARMVRMGSPTILTATAP